MRRHLTPQTPTPEKVTTATLWVAVNICEDSLTPSGVAHFDQVFASLRQTEPGRAALALGLAVGCYHRPCIRHGVIECRPCDRERVDLVCEHVALLEES